MSLTSPRLIVPSIVLSLAALTIVSCGQHDTPTAPSAVTGSTSLPPTVAEHFITLFDETPAEPGPPAPPPASGSAPEPWPPGPPPMAAPGVPVPTPPSMHLRLTPLKVDPEPVRHSGTPVGTFSCRDHKYTWYYDQHLNAETSVGVTFRERENFLDGRFVNRNTAAIRLVVHVPVILHTRWCSAFPKPHYAQTRFKGHDDNGEPVTVSGPLVRLLAP